MIAATRTETDNLVEKLTAKYLPLTKKLARNFSEDRDWLADDFESEACHKLARLLKHPYEMSKLPTAAVATALQNACIDLWRRMEREGRIEVRQFADGEEPRDKSIGDTLCGPKGLSCDSEELLGLLSVEDQELVTQHAIDEEPLTEIAERMGASLTEVESRYNRAIEVMKKAAERR